MVSRVIARLAETFEALISFYDFEISPKSWKSCFCHGDHFEDAVSAWRCSTSARDIGALPSHLEFDVCSLRKDLRA